MKRKKMVILAGYLDGESHGLLGPQMAATVIQEHSPYDCIVLAVTRKDDKAFLKKCLAGFFGPERPLVAFSYLSGREDLHRFAKEINEEGALTLLAGPQADVDYLGEKACRDHPRRFQGLSKHFSYALHGPAEQILPFLDHDFSPSPAMLRPDRRDSNAEGSKAPWNPAFLRKVVWNNLYRLGEEGLTLHKVSTAQVLQQIGCPHAALGVHREIDYPSFLGGKEKGKVQVPLRGCSFCDVAVDKGFYGALDLETVLLQIRGLPHKEDGRKIPFELIHENALASLPRLLHALMEREMEVSQINLTLRADWFARNEAGLRSALAMARDMGLRLFLSSMGFESFDDTILSNLHKGLDVAANLRAVRLMRRMKEEFPDHWGYSREEGAVHGFIHPTPWDSKETEHNNQKNIGLYGLNFDILPKHSVPLIIHHASALGDWIREIEEAEAVQFKREGTIIGWWQMGDRFVL